MSAQQLPRRTLLAGGLAALALSACSKDKGAQQATQPRGEGTTPRAGGQLLFAFDGTANTQFALDPHNSAFAPHHRIMRSIFDSLVVALPNHQFGPWLASSWQVSPDGKSFTFKLREDVTFHDGSQLDAAAVKVNFDRLKDPKNALFWQPDLGPYDRSTVLDRFTLRVDFTSSYAPFLANLSKSSLGIISPRAIATYGDQLSLHPVGTGPFKMVRLEPGTQVVVTRNDGYRWAPGGAAHQGPAHLAGITFRNVPEEATRVAVLQSGQAGAADLIPPQNLLAFRSSREFRLLEGELLNHNYSLYLNVQRAPWNDARLREAFRLSLDLGAAVKTIYLGTAPQAWSPLSPSLLGYDATLEGSWRPDKAKAARIFDELGFKPGADGIRQKDGKRLSLVFLDPQGNREKRLDLVTVLRRQLQSNGVELRIETVPTGTFMAKMRAGEYDITAASQFASDPDVLRRIYTPAARSALSISRVDDPELTSLLEAAYQETAQEKRVELYRRAQRLVVERGFAIPVYVLRYSVATAAHVQGITIDSNGFPSFHATWLNT